MIHSTTMATVKRLLDGSQRCYRSAAFDKAADGDFLYSVLRIEIYAEHGKTAPSILREFEGAVYKLVGHIGRRATVVWVARTTVRPNDSIHGLSREILVGANSTDNLALIEGKVQSILTNMGIDYSYSGNALAFPE
jgi:predicted LPLAT superfamily acyltransferase